MDPYWRLAGNAGYNFSIDHIRDRLIDAGFSASPDSRSTLRIDEFPNQGAGWEYRVGTVTFDEEQQGEP
ncbi:MAG TPA: hypothetical protein VMZ71_09445, partial [Gemmataceae bacterium]|nr:hypothetical protein [Gemmataceae bacterium]